MPVVNLPIPNPYPHPGVTWAAEQEVMGPMDTHTAADHYILIDTFRCPFVYLGRCACRQVAGKAWEEEFIDKQ